MKWFDNLRFSIKFFVVMGLLACIMVVFAIYLAVRVNDIQEDIDTITGNQQQQVLIADAIANAHGFIDGDLIRGYGAQTEELENNIAIPLSQYDKSVEAFNEILESFRELVIQDPGITEEDRQQRMNLLQSIEVSYNTYMSYVEQLMIATDNNDRTQVALIKESIVPAETFSTADC